MASTGEAKMIVAYFDRSAAVVNGELGSVSAGWPGELPWGGSQTSTLNPCSSPSAMIARVVSSMC